MPHRTTAAAGASHVAGVTAKAVSAIATRQVTIATLEARYGWKAGTWQDQMLVAADTAGTKDGKVSAAELDAYLANPTDDKFLTSSTMQRLRSDTAKGGGKLDAFTTVWEKSLATAADSNHDGTLAATELTGYLDQVKAGASTSSVWLPDQKQGSYDDKIAMLTGEVDPMAMKQSAKQTGGAPMLSKEFMHIQMDAGGRIPQWVSYDLTAADIAERPASVDRHGDKTNPNPLYRLNNPFHKDVELGDKAVTQYAYDGTKAAPAPFDRGHMKNAEDSPDMEAMYETFNMSNMATQYGELNQHSWATLEGAVSELVQATGGKATIVTGNVYLDPQGKPIPAAQRQMMQPLDGEAPIPVPTHCFKAVLLTQPDGTQKMFAYMVENRKDIPTMLTEYGPMLRSSRVSVDSIEKALGGVDLFPHTGIPKATQAKMEADSTSTIVSPDTVAAFANARVLWPPPATTPPATTPPKA